MQLLLKSLETVVAAVFEQSVMQVGYEYSA